MKSVPGSSAPLASAQRSTTIAWVLSGCLVFAACDGSLERPAGITGDTAITADTTYPADIDELSDTAILDSGEPGGSDADDRDTLDPSDTQAPSVPQNLTATNIGTTSLTLSWQASSDNVAVTRYDVQTNGAGVVVSVDAPGVSYDMMGLTASTDYAFRVRACDRANNCSDWSTQVLATTLAASATGNEPPVARGVTHYGSPNVALTIPDVRANDIDPDGDELSVVVVTEPANGTLTVSSPGAFVYTPNAGFIGADRFVYRVSDGKGGEDTADVRIHIANRTFYVDPAGDDTAVGTSQATPWRTIAKVQAQLYGNYFVPGDVILLKRGATFRESLNVGRSGTAERPLVLGAYGSGARPIISGARAVTGWSVHSGQIYKAPVTLGPNETLKYVFVNAVRQTLARFPNTGWLRTDSGSNNHLIDADLTAAAGTYDGARAVLHAVNWAFERPTIASHVAGGRLNFAAATAYYTPPGDWGYFIENKLNLLDAPGEWYFDTASNQLYLYAPNGVNPSTLAVDVATQSNPLQLGGNHIVADGLSIRHSVNGAVHIVYLNNHVTMRDCEVADSYWGIRAYADDVTLHENVVRDTYDAAITIDGARNIITRNHVHDIAMVPGLGLDVWGYIGMDVKGTDSVVRHNRLDRVGYIAMGLAGDRQLTEENVVHNALAILNDGGGIAFDFLNGATFRRNIITDTLGFPASMSTTQQTNYRISFSLYFGDKRIQNTILEHNVVSNAGTGIHVDHTTRTIGNIVRNNLIYDHQYGVTFSDYSNYMLNETGSNCFPEYNDQLYGNTIFSTKAAQRSMLMLEVYCLDWIRWGSFNNNRYLNPFSDKLVYRHDFQSPRYEYAPGMFGGAHEHFTLAEWKAEPVGLDANSTAFTLAWTPPEPQATSTQLLLNTNRGTRRVVVDGEWMDLDGQSVTGAVEIAPFTGKVLLRK
ncbi:MAG: cadherin-like domain-containing protein [Bradymonadaceae bacterium]|nr:cadherin-like domain-containing protein [Lujinxingiaceae bacterium]